MPGSGRIFSPRATVRGSGCGSRPSRRSSRSAIPAHAAFHHALLAGCRNGRLLAISRELRDNAEPRGAVLTIFPDAVLGSAPGQRNTFGIL